MSRTVIVTGASGLVGSAAVDSFLNAGWEVIAVSRRRPEIISQRPYTHLPVDLQDAEACRRAFGDMPEATHVFYAAVYEKPGLIAGWQDPEQMATNLGMIRNVIEPLAASGRLPRPMAYTCIPSARRRANASRGTIIRTRTGSRKTTSGKRPRSPALAGRYSVPPSCWAPMWAWP
jgi:NAD(P)-dependent dehydrogenase (short-subunit alcohol dehydrogenase family)